MKKYKVELIETYAFYFYQADKFFECATNRVFKIISKAEGDENEN